MVAKGIKTTYNKEHRSGEASMLELNYVVSVLHARIDQQVDNW